MKHPESEFDRDYLRRSKASTPEQKLDWLAAAQELVREVKLKNKGKRLSSKNK